MTERRRLKSRSLLIPQRRKSRLEDIKWLIVLFTLQDRGTRSWKRKKLQIHRLLTIRITSDSGSLIEEFQNPSLLRERGKPKLLEVNNIRERKGSIQSICEVIDNSIKKTTKNSRKCSWTKYLFTVSQKESVDSSERSPSSFTKAKTRILFGFIDKIFKKIKFILF